MKMKSVADAIENIPILADTDPENILAVLMALKGVMI
jgi:hypothetical protein